MSLGALSVSGRPGLRNPYLGMMQNMPHILHPYPYRFRPVAWSWPTAWKNPFWLTAGKRLAAFIAEPISGASLGAVVPPDDYWPRIRQICDRYGVLLIADEVLVGMGRTGKWWGLDHWNIRPDILITSKGTASGYFPLGFVAANGRDVDQIFHTLGDFNHGGTFSHHAVGAAAGLATLRILQREKLVENAANLGPYLNTQLHHTFAHHTHIGDIRGRGLFWGLEIVQDRATKTPFPAKQKTAWHIAERAFELGLVIYYSQGCADGASGDVIMLGPPLIINQAQIDEMVAILDQTVTEILG
jgi:adenosylmethionine-8-amino-7-oxononanoate aminotransferase